MLTKAILIYGLATYLTDGAVIKGENCSVSSRIQFSSCQVRFLVEPPTSSVQWARVSGRRTSTTATSQKRVGSHTVADLTRSKSSLPALTAVNVILIQVLWVHNDSGGSTWINAISEHGEMQPDIT